MTGPGIEPGTYGLKVTRCVPFSWHGECLGMPQDPRSTPETPATSPATGILRSSLPNGHRETEGGRRNCSTLTGPKNWGHPKLHLQVSPKRRSPVPKTPYLPQDDVAMVGPNAAPTSWARSYKSWGGAPLTRC
jgi:hypothetical protein